MSTLEKPILKVEFLNQPNKFNDKTKKHTLDLERTLTVANPTERSAMKVSSVSPLH